MRLIITILIVGICAFPLANIEPFSKVINDRIQTLSNVQKDGSYQARSATYNRAFGVALTEPVGKGIGLPGVDSAVIDILFAMGWLGAIPYLGGLFLLTYQSINAKEKRLDPFINISNAISLGLLTTIIGGNGLTAVSGVILWSFLSLSLAGQKYYKHQLLLAHSGNFPGKKSDFKA
jgi:hypothetical protein